MRKAKQLLIAYTIAFTAAFTFVLAGGLANQAQACPCSEKKQVSAKKKNGACTAPKAPRKTAKQKQGKAGAGKRS